MSNPDHGADPQFASPHVAQLQAFAGMAERVIGSSPGRNQIGNHYHHNLFAALACRGSAQVYEVLCQEPDLMTEAGVDFILHKLAGLEAKSQ